MEALARHDLFSSPGLPKLRSFCLWSVASSTQLADQAAEELMAASAQSVGQADAARAFWFRLMACVAAWRGVEDAGGDFSESVLGGCGHHAHLEAPDTVAATLRLWLLKVEDGPATSSRTPSSTSWTPSSGVKGRWLLREEARQHLTSWASKLCWANALASNATPGAWRSVGQGGCFVHGFLKRDAFWIRDGPGGNLSITCLTFWEDLGPALSSLAILRWMRMGGLLDRQDIIAGPFL
ncbi:Hypothetical protein SCF082_LOCUS50326 [Durusdinium trenchii]|uniref:Uncharacterized protein n=1 Tax=Durusdinium trenchii TaxID=1381693 RepID=A0ABP0S794_9DINO